MSLPPRKRKRSGDLICTERLAPPGTVPQCKYSKGPAVPACRGCALDLVHLACDIVNYKPADRWIPLHNGMLFIRRLRETGILLSRELVIHALSYLRRIHPKIKCTAPDVTSAMSCLTIALDAAYTWHDDYDDSLFKDSRLPIEILKSDQLTFLTDVLEWRLRPTAAEWREATHILDSSVHEHICSEAASFITVPYLFAPTARAE